MSHDFSLTCDDNYCSSCNRVDSHSLGEFNVSYNHCWIWYDKFDKERGFKAIYKVPIIKLIPRLETLQADMIFLFGGLPTHTMVTDKEHISYGRKDFGEELWTDTMIDTVDLEDNGSGKFKKMKDDGWAKTRYNAYRCVHTILVACYKNVDTFPLAEFYGD